MKNTGLSTKHINLLRNIFTWYPQVQKAILYGSRAKGTYTERSDIDLVVTGENIDRFLIARILLDIDESDLPFKVDLQDYHAIINKNLIEHIDRVGKVFYEKEKLSRG